VVEPNGTGPLLIKHLFVEHVDLDLQPRANAWLPWLGFFGTPKLRGSSNLGFNLTRTNLNLNLTRFNLTTNLRGSTYGRQPQPSRSWRCFEVRGSRTRIAGRASCFEVAGRGPRLRRPTTSVLERPGNDRQRPSREDDRRRGRPTTSVPRPSRWTPPDPCSTVDVRPTCTGRRRPSCERRAKGRHLAGLRSLLGSGYGGGEPCVAAVFDLVG
jgi:hypothetical protein